MTNNKRPCRRKKYTTKELDGIAYYSATVEAEWCQECQAWHIKYRVDNNANAIVEKF